jgi:hypothetical protein
MDRNRLIQFFEGDNGRLSMARLTMFAAFFPASYVMVTHPSEGMMGWYVGGFVLGYVGGKGMDVMKGGTHVDDTARPTKKRPY